jgi:hypothetical protein
MERSASARNAGYFAANSRGRASARVSCRTSSCIPSGYTARRTCAVFATLHNFFLPASVADGIFCSDVVPMQQRAGGINKSMKEHRRDSPAEAVKLAVQKEPRPDGAMLDIVEPLFREAGCDPEAIRVMGQAFIKACHSLHDFGQPDIVLEIIAKRIIEVAKTGERDRDRLCEQALRAFGIFAPD